MKKFTIEVSHASTAQLSTIALELKIMANGWEKHGPRIMINGQQVKAPSLRIEGSSSKPQATSRKRHKLAMFLSYFLIVSVSRRLQLEACGLNLYQIFS